MLTGGEVRTDREVRAGRAVRRVVVILGGRPAEDPDPSGAAVRALPRSDRAAVALALDRFGAPVRAFTLEDDEDALRYALAAGAVSAERVADPRAIEFDVALIGTGGAGAWGDLLAAALAARREAALVLETLDVATEGGRLVVTRDLGRGDREVLTIDGPAVLGVSEDAAARIYVSWHRRRAARIPPAGTDTVAPAPDPLANLGGPWEPVRPRARATDIAARTGGAAKDRMNALFGLMGAGAVERDEDRLIVADAATCARHLVRFLSHHGMIEGARPEETTTAPPPATRSGQAESAAETRPPRRRTSPGGPRGPRPLREEPPERPDPPGDEARGPRPLEGETPKRRRGPRPIDPKSS